MKTHAWIVAALLAASGANANTPADYAYVFPIETGNRTQPGDSSAWRVDLTPAVYAWVQDAALRDIEVFNAAGRPVPAARLVAPAATTRMQEAALPMLALPAAAERGDAGDLRLVIERDAGGRLRRIDADEHADAAAAPGAHAWLLDASRVEHAFDRLVLSWDTPASGVVARFGVDAGDDLQAWRPVGDGTVLALEQDGAQLRRNDIELGGVRAKYLRLRRVDDGAALGGLVARVRWFDGHDSAARTWLDAQAVATPADALPAPPGVVRFDYTLPAALPVDAARIGLASDNALAPLLLYARMPATAHDEWRELARITAFRLRDSGATIRNGDVDVSSAVRLRAFRIDARVPLAVAPRLALGYRPDGLVFLAEGDGPYVLAAGSARAVRADYPLDAALAVLRTKFGHAWQPPLARLGPAQASAGAAALKPLPAPLPWRRYALWAVLVAAAALVGGFALSLLREARGANKTR